MGSRPLRSIGALCAVALTPAAAQGAWNQPVGGPSPINQANTQIAFSSSLTAIGGVPSDPGTVTVRR